jgi:hypothetical protein
MLLVTSTATRKYDLTRGHPTTEVRKPNRYQLESANHAVALALLRQGFRSERSGLSGWHTLDEQGE